jgi:alkylation response protein AidB-like acyl-CoA dehydrogenase
MTTGAHAPGRDDVAALRDAVRELLARECPPEVVRAGWPGGDDAVVAALWRRFAQAGGPAVLVPEDAGGLGLDEAFLVAVLEETGYAALPAPTVETDAVAAPLLAGSPPHADLLAAMLDGTATLSVATDPAAPVAYGQRVDAVVVLDGGAAAVVRAGRREPVAAVDGARRLARLDLSGGEPLAAAADTVAKARLRGSLATAAELVGLSRRMLAMTVRYVTERHQFGVPIGSFQAVKHHLADALLAVEFAAPLVARAADALAAGAPAARRDVSMAKASASDAARSVAKLTLQCHGAMAYTTEYDHHLYAKRAWAQAAAWGDAAQHRGVVAAELGLAQGGDPL